MPEVVFILNKDTGLLEAADTVKCDRCNGTVIGGAERHRRRRQLENSKNWTRIRPMCAKCDGHGKVIQSGKYWRRMYKKAEDCYLVGELPPTQSYAGSSKAMVVAQKAFEGYNIPEKLKAFLTEEMRKKSFSYQATLQKVTEAMVFKAWKENPHHITRAAERLNMNRATFTKILKGMKDED